MYSEYAYTTNHKLKRPKMNKDTIKGKFEQLKGTVQEKWGELTNDPVDQIEGKSKKLAGKLQEKKGEAEDQLKK